MENDPVVPDYDDKDGKMRDYDNNRPTWRFFDGSVSISGSMLLAVLLTGCQGCRSVPLLDYLGMLTAKYDGVIIVATLLLFPTSLALYGVLIMFFAAKEFVEKRAAQRGREEGRKEGREEGRLAERERIQRELEARGVAVTPELAGILTGRSE